MCQCAFCRVEHLLSIFRRGFTAQGPGLGNVQFSSGEVFTQVSTPSVDDTTNILPPDYPGRKHFGVNVMTMLNGYMVGIFAPDSGQAPGDGSPSMYPIHAVSA